MNDKIMKINDYVKDVNHSVEDGVVKASADSIMSCLCRMINDHAKTIHELEKRIEELEENKEDTKCQDCGVGREQRRYKVSGLWS